MCSYASLLACESTHFPVGAGSPTRKATEHNTMPGIEPAVYSGGRRRDEEATLAPEARYPLLWTRKPRYDK